MGVNHLKRDAAIAHSQAAQGHTNVPQSQQVSSGDQFKRPASTSGTRQVPEVGAVNSFEGRAVRTGTHPAQPPKGNANGGRGGAKNGQATIGTRSGNKKGMSGGRMG